MGMEQIGLEAIMETGSFMTGMAGYMKQLDLANGKTSSAAGSMGQQFIGLGNNVLKFAGGVAVAGLTALAAGIGFAMKEAMGAQAVEAQLNAVIESTGGAAGVSAEMAKELANSLMLVSTFSDDAILSGENMLLTFTNIGKDVFPQATEVMLDMSQALGQDLKSSAMQLGKALNDPIAGIAALQRVGVKFTDEQKKMIETMVKAGDVAGAQKLILEELAKEFGGSAAAAVATFSGQLTLATNVLSNVAEGIGMALLPILNNLFQSVIIPALPVIQQMADNFINLIGAITDAGFFSTETSEALSLLVGPEIAQGIMNLATWFKDLATTIGTFVTGTLIPFVTEHWEAFKGALIAVGAILAAAAIAATIAGIAGAIAAMINPISLLIGAVALLGAAWAEDWGGIRTMVTDWWNTSGKPVFDQLVNVLSVVLPQALAIASQFWSGVLQPALQNFWNWVSANVFPIVGQLVTWLGTNLAGAIQSLSAFWTNVLLPASQTFWNWIATVAIPKAQELWSWLSEKLSLAITTLAGFWENTLKPAIENVWTFIQTSVLPLFDSLAKMLKETLRVAVEIGAGVWKDILKPALEGVWKYIDANILPLFRTLADFLGKTFGPALEEIKSKGLDGLKKGFEDLKGVLDGVKDKIDAFAKVLQGISWDTIKTSLQAFLPGSLPPLAQGFVDIAAKALELAGNFAKNLVPSLKDLKEWAEKLTVDFWKTYFIDPFDRIATFVNETFIPTWDLLVFKLTTSFPLAVKTWKLSMEQMRIEIVQTDIVAKYLVNSIGDLVSAMEGSKSTFSSFETAMGGVSKAIEGVMKQIEDLQKALDNLDIPEEVTPGSPTPFETGLWGINRALQAVTMSALELGDRLGRALLGVAAAAEKPFETIMGMAGVLGSMGNAAGSLFQKQTLDPLQLRIDEKKEQLDAQIKQLMAMLGISDLQEFYNRLPGIGSGMAMGAYSDDAKFLWDVILTAMKERNDLTNEYIAQQKRLAELQEKQDQLSFLQQQMKLLDLIRENGLNAEDILGGLKLGLDADLPSVIDAMVRAMQLLVGQAEDELGIHSPSTVAASWAENVMTTFASGIDRLANRPVEALNSVMGQIAAPQALSPVNAGSVSNSMYINMGGVNISNGMDEVLFENWVEDIVTRKMRQ